MSSDTAVPLDGSNTGRVTVPFFNRLALLIAVCAVPTASAQQLVSDGRDPRFEALNAVLRFRDDLRDTSTVIAQCRLFNVGRDSSQANAIDARFRKLFVLPATTDSARLTRCEVSEFAVPNTRVLWLEGLV